MYISARLDKSTKVTNHITTTLLLSTHFAEVPLEQALRGLIETVQYFLIKLGIKPRTLVYRIDVQDEINVQEGKFLKKH